MVNCSTKIVKDILLDNGLVLSKKSKKQKPVLFWSISGVQNEFYLKLDYSQKINHFPFSNQITRKDFLYINIIKMKNRFPSHFNFIPNSFLLPQDRSLLINVI